MSASVSLLVEQGASGLWYITSPDLKGLLVAGDTLEKAIGDVPRAGREMLAVMRESGADHENRQYAAYASMFA